MKEITLRGQRVALYALDTVVVGSGCAGFNAADTLFDLGRRDIALLTEGVNMGTSRNTGSDKQTYYKLSLCADAQDSVYQLAENLFAGGSVNGDTALAEAASSVRSFMKLVNLGVPFPTNRYGEYVGYKTDHDPRQRATSCGPLTSKVMTEKLEASVRQKGIPLLDGFQAVRLLVEEGRVAGLVALDKSRLSQEDWGLAVFLCGQVVLATGGFSIYDTSLAGASKAVMWIVTVFSFLAGVNFSLMFLAVRGKLKEVLRSEELRIYVGIVAAATLLLCINLRVQAGVPFRDSITDAAFQTVTIITTTGFATVDFSLWPTFCRMALVMLMFTGACAGSTSGGIKISRVAILCKSLKRELKRLAHPHHVSVLKVDGQAVEERVVSSAGAFIAAYLLVLLAGALVVSWDNYGFQESFAASLTCISNVGPGLGILGPMENFSILSPLSKLVLSLEMLMGRLELMPLLALFLGSTWRD